MRRHSGTSHILAALLTAGMLLVAGAASAGQEQARKFFKEAKTAYQNGEYERAATLLEKAYAEEANLTYQYNRIRALQGAEEYERALEVLNTYEKPMLDAKGFEDIPDLKEALREKVGATETSSSSSSSSPSASGPADSMTDPEPRDGPSPPPRSDDPTMTYVGWGLAGTGIALLGTGTLYASTLLLPEETRKRVQNDEPLTETDDERIQRQKTLSIVFLSVGAGALIGGGVILLNQRNQPADSDPATAARTLRVAPWATREGAGARLQIQF